MSSYGCVISAVCMPLGFLLAGPLGDAIGLDKTLFVAAAIFAGAKAARLVLPSVRRMPPPA